MTPAGLSQGIDPQIEESWKIRLRADFNDASFLGLREFLRLEKSSHTVYPAGNMIFEAFNRTPFDDVKAVILGQDPYHGAGQAHGLCFSVPSGVRVPPSLQNIFRELHSDVGIQIPTSGDLSSWAGEGVLLLNSVLTVRAGQAGSHRGKGWESLTDSVIRNLSQQKDNLVFILWGKFAADKAGLIDGKRHCILMAPHPSPYSANSGFFGCRHFSKANEYLRLHGISGINWNPAR